MDLCYYYLLRDSGGYGASNANNRIDNFKKSVARYGDNSAIMGYKDREIENFSDDLYFGLLHYLEPRLATNGRIALVPMPTSIPKSHEHFDNRLERLCQLSAEKSRFCDYVEVFDAVQVARPVHAGGNRSMAAISVNIKLLPFPAGYNTYILIDDVITTGMHFKACKEKLLQACPNATILGAFLARQRNQYDDCTFSY